VLVDQPECEECGGACCLPERLEFPLPRNGAGWRHVSEWNAHGVLAGMGLPDAQVLGTRVNAHGRTVIRTDCPRRGHCDTRKRPVACLMFPSNYLDPDHSDAERDEIRAFCALFRRLEREEVPDEVGDEER
jgi:hypothetical protein